MRMYTAYYELFHALNFRSASWLVLFPSVESTKPTKWRKVGWGKYYFKVQCTFRGSIKRTHFFVPYWSLCTIQIHVLSKGSYQQAPFFNCGVHTQLFSNWPKAYFPLKVYCFLKILRINFKNFIYSPINS